MKKVFKKKVSGLTFELTNFQLIEGHDDSLPYVGTLFIDGNYACKCFNDGWGGMTDTSDRTPFFDKAAQTLEEKKAHYTYQGIRIDYTIDFIADELAYEMASNGLGKTTASDLKIARERIMFLEKEVERLKKELAQERFLKEKAEFYLNTKRHTK